MFIIATSPSSPNPMVIQRGTLAATKATCCKSTNKGGAGAGGGFSTYAGNSSMNHETLGKTVLKCFFFKMRCQIPEDWRMIWSKRQFWTQILISAVIFVISLNKKSTDSRSLKTLLGAMALQLIPLGVNSGLVGDLLKCFCPNFVMPHQPTATKTSKTPETLLYFLLLYLKFPRFIKTFKYWRKLHMS